MSADNPTHVKLYETILSHLPVDDSEAARNLLDTIWPEVVELLAKIVEYEHALEHVSECTEGCGNCSSLAQTALDGVNREMCREIVNDA